MTLLTEWYLNQQLRPPPPTPPDDFLSTLQRGDELEMFYEDGWWEVNYLSSRSGDQGAVEYTVESAQYVVEHIVPGERLRPRWRRQGSKWRKSDAQLKQQPAKKKAKAAPAAAAAAPKASKASKASKAPKTAAASSKPLRDGEPLEVEAEVSEGVVRWVPAVVLQLLVDGSFQALVQVPGDPFEDWFKMEDEGKDWRRPKPPPTKAAKAAKAVAAPAGPSGSNKPAPAPAAEAMPGSRMERCATILAALLARDDARWFDDATNTATDAVRTAERPARPPPAHCHCPPSNPPPHTSQCLPLPAASYPCPALCPVSRTLPRTPLRTPLRRRRRIPLPRLVAWPAARLRARPRTRPRVRRRSVTRLCGSGSRQGAMAPTRSFSRRTFVASTLRRWSGTGATSCRGARRPERR